MATLIVNPGESIDRAARQAASGDTIIIRPGTYHEAVTINKSGITLMGDGTGRVILDGKAGQGSVNAGLPRGAMRYDNRVPSAGNKKNFQGWPVRDIGFTYAAMLDVMASNVTIKDIEIRNSLGRGMRVWDFANQRVIRNITLENVIIHHTRSQSIAFNMVHNFSVTDCVFEMSEENAPFFRKTSEVNWAPGVGLLSCKRGTFTRCKVAGGWGEGLFIQPKKPRVVNGELATCYDITVQDCTLYGFRKGSLVAMATRGIKLLRNFIPSPTDYTPHTGSPGMTLEAVEPQLGNAPIIDALVQDNIIVGNGANFVFRMSSSQNSSNLRIINNTFANGQSSGIGLTGYTSDFGSGNVFKDNIIIQRPGSRCVGDNGPNHIARNWTISGNLWTDMTQNAEKGWFRNGTLVNGTDVLVNPFAPIRTDTMSIDNYRQKAGYQDKGAVAIFEDNGGTPDPPIDPPPNDGLGFWFHVYEGNPTSSISNGVYSINSAGIANRASWLSKNIDVKASELYQLSGSIRSMLQAGNAQVMLVFYSNDGYVSAESVHSVTGETAWSDFDFVFSPPENVTRVRVDLRLWRAAGMGSWQNIEFVQVEDDDPDPPMPKREIDVDVGNITWELILTEDSVTAIRRE